MVRDWETGFLVDRGDEAGICHRVDQLLHDQMLWANMSSSASRDAKRVAVAGYQDTWLDLMSRWGGYQNKTQGSVE